MLYFKRKIASHWKLLLLIIGICAVSLYCIIDLVIWSDGYAVENLCCLDIFSFAGFRGFTAVVLSIVGLFLAYRVLHGYFAALSQQEHFICTAGAVFTDLELFAFHSVYGYCRTAFISVCTTKLL